MNYPSRNLDLPVSSVILDFGGVLGLLLDPSRAANIASLCRLSLEAFSRLYERDRMELDRGTMSADEYWARILLAARVPPAPALIARIKEEDLLGWTRINTRLVDWAAELRAAGYVTAILSNMPSDRLAYMRKSPAFSWIDNFQVAVFSCNHQLVKPEPAIYRLCLDLLGKAPEECVFLDDSPINIAVGRASRIRTLLFHSADEAAPILSDRWGLPVKSLRQTPLRSQKTEKA